MTTYLDINLQSGLPVTTDTVRLSKTKPGSGNPQFDKLMNAIANLDYATLSTDPVMQSLRIDLITQCVGDRATLRALANQDSVLIQKFKSFEADMNLAGGADATAGSLMAVAISASLIPSGIGQIVGAVLAVGVLIFEAVDALTWFNRAKAWNESLSQHVVGVLGSDSYYNDDGLLGINLAGVSMVNEWHGLNRSEGEGALINLLPKYSVNPKTSIQYWYMVTTWINLSSALVQFYNNITLADYNALQKSYDAGQLLHEMPTSLESLAGLTNSVDALLQSTSAADLAGQVNALINTANKAGSTGSQAGSTQSQLDSSSGYVLLGVGVIFLIVGIFYLARGQA
ncbi:MAG: hypothetical protein JRN15_04840 [Nitrososphaerota archaeon]|nr:hypothetical protein [Nitrososphaerota archaeon]